MFRKILLLNRSILNSYIYGISNNAQSSIICTSIANMSSSNNKIATYDDVVAATKNQTIYIIDVREPEELQETGTIPNSINIPLGEVESTLKTYSNKQFESKFGRAKPDEDTPIIFSCKLGKRAGMALDTAAKLGYHNLQNYQGSWLDWEEHLKNKQ